MKWVLCFAVLFLVACSSAPQTPSFVSGKTKQFEMVASQFAFEPAVITVGKGDNVELYITSADVAHGISLSAFNVRAILEPGKTTKVSFIADKTGMHEFRCSVQCGEGHAHMTGAIEVVEETP